MLLFICFYREWKARREEREEHKNGLKAVKEQLAGKEAELTQIKEMGERMAAKQRAEFEEKENADAEKQKQREEHGMRIGKKRLEKLDQAKTMKVCTSEFKAWIKYDIGREEWEDHAKMERLWRKKREAMARAVDDVEDSADADSES